MRRSYVDDWKESLTDQECTYCGEESHKRYHCKDITNRQPPKWSKESIPEIEKQLKPKSIPLWTKWKKVQVYNVANHQIVRCRHCMTRLATMTCLHIEDHIRTHICTICFFEEDYQKVKLVMGVFDPGYKKYLATQGQEFISHKQKRKMAHVLFRTIHDWELTAMHHIHYNQYCSVCEIHDMDWVFLPCGHGECRMCHLATAQCRECQEDILARANCLYLEAIKNVVTKKGKTHTKTLQEVVKDEYLKLLKR